MEYNPGTEIKPQPQMKMSAMEDVEKQPATEFRVLQDNADKFQHNKDLRAVDSMTVRSTEGRETLLKLALPAPQGSGNAGGPSDEAGQAGSC